MTGGNWSTGFTFWMIDEERQCMMASPRASQTIRINLAVKSAIVDPFCVEIEVLKVF